MKKKPGISQSFLVTLLIIIFLSLTNFLINAILLVIKDCFLANKINEISCQQLSNLIVSLLLEVFYAFSSYL